MRTRARMPGQDAGPCAVRVGCVVRKHDTDPPRTRAAQPSAAAGGLERLGQVWRQRRAQLEERAAEGLPQLESRGVQELTTQPVAPGGPVLAVAAHRVRDRLEVRADLVRAPRLETH